MGSLLIFILILVALIIAHEFGHFVVAKAFGIRVDEFGIFFPPKLLSWKRGETTYTLNALPFGGFVRIFGESTDEEDPAVTSDPRSFVKKSRWIQAAVLLAGIFFNLVFAWLLLSAGYMLGMQSFVEHKGVGVVRDAKTTIVDVVPNSPAQKVGLEPNDTILSLQTGTAKLAPGSNSSQTKDFIAAHQNESIIINVDRAGKQMNFLAVPVDGLTPGHKAIGVEMDDLGILKLSPPLALVQGAIFAEEMTVETVKGLGGLVWSLVRGHADLQGVAGPIGIATIGSNAVKQGIEATILLTALISINLAIFNLLPVPGLDGGRLLFVIIEGIRGKPISQSLVLKFTLAGFGLLILLTLLTSYHDIVRLVHPA
jgi:regulator of sigma E protease